MAWGDCDNDGDLDVLEVGRSNIGAISHVYRNMGSDTFADASANLSAIDNGSAAWGDSDNDGDLDNVLSGRDANLALLAKVYRNDGSNTFTELISLTGMPRRPLPS